ncbi:hypothetical protein B0H10DRAFT_927279 [Mycena sp. CBHHK59/15]|nr:hypothetical protein B0H10DRAFT_927279 [Mycena sp. CBHHK59/15]
MSTTTCTPDINNGICAWILEAVAVPIETRFSAGHPRRSHIHPLHALPVGTSGFTHSYGSPSAETLHVQSSFTNRPSALSVATQHFPEASARCQERSGYSRPNYPAPPAMSVFDFLLPIRASSDYDSISPHSQKYVAISADADFCIRTRNRTPEAGPPRPGCLRPRIIHGKAAHTRRNAAVQSRQSPSIKHPSPPKYAAVNLSFSLSMIGSTSLILSAPIVHEARGGSCCPKLGRKRLSGGTMTAEA